MFKPVRVIVLFIVSLLLTALLYWIDSDPPTDSVSQMAVMAAVDFVVVTILYCIAYGLLKQQNKKTARKAA